MYISFIFIKEKISFITRYFKYKNFKIIFRIYPKIYQEVSDHFFIIYKKVEKWEKNNQKLFKREYSLKIYYLKNRFFK